MLQNLLIVEDNPSMRRLIRSVVEDIADSIHEREDGSEALAAYEEFSPDWVVMDVEMKQMDGLTAADEIIRSHPEAKILILTKYDSKRIREEATRIGAASFVLKEDLLLMRQICDSVI